MSVVLNVVAAKPISIFVWWLYAGGNRTTFHGRAELARRVARARMARRPVCSRRTISPCLTIRWSECDVENNQAHGGTPRDVQQIADDIRAAVVRLQSHWRSEESRDA